MRETGEAAGDPLGRDWKAELGLLQTLMSLLDLEVGEHFHSADYARLQVRWLARMYRVLAAALDAKDNATSGHSVRVARLSQRLAQQLGCTAAQVDTAYWAGLLHDIGKIGIDDAVLGKPGRLTAAEQEHVQQHPWLGNQLLGKARAFADVLPAVLHHHEAWDGGGYPQRLKGDEIPFLARLVAVADAYDALTSNRPYRQGLPEPLVADELLAGAARRWDPQVIAAFWATRDDFRRIRQEA